ncbi:MAG: hypothetical protein LBL00_00430 [Endomicrobium sp.]|jgi:hypothetical protein|nr:hypothetical protein [Endomicrobium sp.]
MKFKLSYCFVLSVLFIGNISFAVNSEEVLENPYGFELVEEAGKTSTEIESGGKEKVDMEEVNKNDTYQAQSKAEAERKKRERELEAAKKKAEEESKKKKKEPAKEKKPETRKVANKISEKFNNFMKDPKVIKFINTVKYGWAKFKKWFVTLPGVRHWLASPYSMENYKRDLGTAGKENSAHLKKNSAGVKLVKEGSKKFFK